MADSIITKRAIADALKELTLTKSFDKISVKDITEKCGINRQTFYYHFVDKFNLLEWIYINDLLEQHMMDVNFDNWPERLEALLSAMQSDKVFYINTIKHTENYIQEYMISQAQTIFEDAINTIDEKSHVDQEQRNFIARFFAYGVCGMVIEWAMKNMESSPAYISENMKMLKDKCEQAAYEHIIEIKST